VRAAGEIAAKRKSAVRMKMTLRIVSLWCSTLGLQIQPVVGQFAENAEEI